MENIQHLLEQAHIVGEYNAETFPYAENNLIRPLLRVAEQPEREIYVYFDDNNKRSSYTGSEFVAKVQAVASVLHRHGITNGSRIAIAAYNHPDTIFQYFAAWAMGACVVPLNMSEDDARLRYIIENANARLLLCREEYVERMNEIISADIELVPVCTDESKGLWAQATSAERYIFSVEQNLLTEEALIVYTSGTTGNPKGVVLTQANLIADADAIISWQKITVQDTTMCVLPVHHVNGTIVTHVTPLLAGAKMVLCRKFKSDTFLSTIEQENVTIVSVVPTLLAYLLEYHQTPVRPETLRHIVCGAGPLTCELVRRFEDFFGIKVLHGYGLSETTCYSCFLPLDITPQEHRSWLLDYNFPSIGVPIAANEMDIHDEQGISVPPDVKGEIVIRGANVMKEYYNNPTANASTFAFGWFRSGDEGFYKISEDGRKYFFITGRIKELIIRGGVNLAPLEIDEVLCSAPGVKAGICVGFENDFYGEEVGALVIRKNNTVTEAEILSYCQEHLPFSKAPKVVVFADELPVTTTGKYQRNKVKHLFAQWKASQFRKHT